MKKPFVLAAGILLFGSGYALGQRKPPTANSGFREELLRGLSLEKEFPTTAGRTFRMRKLTLQPGGVLGVHDHNDRPALTYVLEGQVTYRSAGQPDQVIKAGEGMAEGRGATHWAENTGKVPAVWIGVDIPKP
jgi:quercetin dioxygenase-like cupin family protein